MPINYMPTQYPRHIPSLQPKLPQLIMSLIGNYMQNKYATDRQKEEMEFRAEEARKDRDYKRTELGYQAKLGQDNYLTDMNVEHTRLDSPKAPEDYDQSEVIRGRTLLDGTPTYYVKKREIYPIPMWKRIKTSGDIVEVKAKTPIEYKLFKADNYVRGDVTAAKVSPADKAASIEEKRKAEVNKKLASLTGHIRKQALQEQKEDAATTLANVKAELKEPKTWREFVRYKTEAYIAEGKKVTPKDKALWMLEFEKAGAINLGRDIPGEKLDIAKRITVADTRLELTASKRDRAVFKAQGPRFNTENQQNEVAYWDTEGWDQTKIIKLSKEALDNGWTPAEVQRQANISGMTVKQVLKRIDELSK